MQLSWGVMAGAPTRTYLRLGRKQILPFRQPPALSVYVDYEVMLVLAVSAMNQVSLADGTVYMCKVAECADKRRDTCVDRNGIWKWGWPGWMQRMLWLGYMFLAEGSATSLSAELRLFGCVSGMLWGSEASVSVRDAC